MESMIAVKFLVYINIFFAIITVLYNLVYIRYRNGYDLWLWIKALYAIVGVSWIILYGYVIIKGLDMIPISFARPLITLTLGSLAAGAVLRVKSNGYKVKDALKNNTKHGGFNDEH